MVQAYLTLRIGFLEKLGFCKYGGTNAFFLIGDSCEEPVIKKEKTAFEKIIC